MHLDAIDSPSPNGQFSAIAITSANAIRALTSPIPKKWLKLPLFVPGTATKNAAREAGFLKIDASGENAVGVALALAHHLPPKSHILYICAQTVAHDLRSILEPHDIACTNWVVYRAQELEQFSTQLETMFQQGAIDIVRLYSPRTAQTFARLWQSMAGSVQLPTFHVLSDQIRQALPPSWNETVVVAKKPNEAAMRALLNH